MNTPKMISYAQCFEDVILARVFKGKQAGFYIDVGVWHPSLDSVTKYFYDLGWSGVNIEALPRQFELIKDARPRDTNINAAASTQPGPLVFHEFQGTGLSTSRTDYAAEHAKAGHAVESLEVSTVTLKSVCDEHVRDKVIDFMKIDVEGAEADVVNSADWVTYRPRVLLIEATVPSSPEESFADWEPKVLDSNYVFCYFDGLNRWYVRSEDIELKSAFYAPPNPFDNYVLARVVELERKVSGLKRETQQLRSASSTVRGALGAVARSVMRRLS